jgi:hypothetical protein
MSDKPDNYLLYAKLITLGDTPPKGLSYEELIQRYKQKALDNLKRAVYHIEQCNNFLEEINRR